MSSLRIFHVCLLGTLAFLPVTLSADDDTAGASLTLHVPEDAEAGSLVGIVGDGDRKCRYSIVSGNPEAAFSVEARTGRLTVDNAAALNHERRAQIDLMLQVERPAADDSARRAFLNDVIASGASLQTVRELSTDTELLHVSVLVDDVAERPVLPVQTVTVVVDGNESVQDARIDAHDEDRNDALRFEILGGAPTGLFAVEAETGRLRIDPAAALMPGEHEFPLTVRVTDSSGHSDATTITVRVIALADEPGALVVPAPLTGASDPSPPPIDPEDGSADAVGESDSVESTANGPPVAAVPVDGAPRADSGTRADASGNAGPAAESTGSPLLNVAGMFLLLGVFVAAVLWYLKRRKRAEPRDVFEQERLRRLQLMSDESDATEPAAERETDTVDLEESIVHQVSGLQQLLTEQSQPTHSTNEQQGEAGDAALSAVEASIQQEDSRAPLAFSTGLLDATVPAETRSDTDEDHNDALNELYEISNDESYEFGPDEDDDGAAAGDSRQFDGLEAAPDAGGLFDFSESEATPVSGELFESIDNDSQLPAEADEPSMPPVNERPAENIEQQNEACSIPENAPDGSSAGTEQAETGTDGRGEPDENEATPVAGGWLETAGDDWQLHAAAAEDRTAPPLDEVPPIEHEFYVPSAADAASAVGAVDGAPADEWGTPPLDRGPVEFVAEQNDVSGVLQREPADAEDEPAGAATDVSRELIENEAPAGDGGWYESITDGAQSSVVASDEQWAPSPTEDHVESVERRTGEDELPRPESDVVSPGEELRSIAIDSAGGISVSEATSDVGESFEPVKDAAEDATDIHPLTPDQDQSVESQRESVADWPMDGDAGTAPDAVPGAAESPEAATDPRVRHLREVLAEKFGMVVTDAGADSDSLPAHGEGSSAAESGSASLSAIAGPVNLPATAPDEASGGDDPGLLDIQGDEAWGGGLSTARFLLPKVLDASADASEPATELAAAVPETPPPVKAKRRNKSEIRRELSSLREVAIRHARSRMAQEAPRHPTRRTWYVSACAMVVLNFAAMGIMGAAPSGLLKLLGWTLMLAGACALAVCLHSFQQMDADEDLPNRPGADQAEQSPAGDTSP